MNGVISGETLIGTITTDETLTGILTNPKNIDLSGDTITPGDLRSGVKAHDSTGTQITGSMVDNGAVTGNISTKEGQYIINEGYHNGNGKVSIDSSEKEKIIPENIKKDISILGITGTLEASNIDWGAIGYDGEPQVIQSGYNYAVEIKNNWTPAVSLNNKFNNDYDLIIMPLVDTSSTTAMQSMFNNCYGLISIPLLDTSKVTDMSSMFYGTSIYTIPLLDTSKVTTMQNMFNNCNCLKYIPLLDTSSVAKMQNMFYQCTNLHSVPLLNTSSVTTMRYMFILCSNLTDESLDNILQMCINTTSVYTRPKTLTELGFNVGYYSASRIQALSHYQDFINAGWTIGY